MDDADLVWIPRGVRSNLDRAGLRIHLVDWQRLPIEERRALASWPEDAAADIAAFRARVLSLVPHATRTA